MPEQEKFKIIGVDNYDRETRSDTFVADNVSEYYAKRIVDLLNKSAGTHSETFYKYVPLDHKLFVWEP